MEIRNLTKNQSMKYIREVEEDLQYSMEVTALLDKYYKSNEDEFFPSRKRAGYRTI